MATMKVRLILGLEGVNSDAKKLHFFEILRFWACIVQVRSQENTE